MPKRPTKVTLTVKRVGPHQYRVNQEYVDLRGDTPCHCADYLYRKESKGADCKHLRAAKLMEGTPTNSLKVTL